MEGGGGGGLATANPSSLDDLFSTQTTEVDVGMEWLSIFVEDCFSNRGDCYLPVATTGTRQPANTTSKKPPLFNLSSASTSSLLPQFAVAGKARSKRKRIAAAAKGSRRASLSSGWCVTPLFPSSDPPPLLDQAYWMADSELIAPKEGGSGHSYQQHKEKENKQKKKTTKKVEGGRRCSHCMSQRTPQWRAGPMGPKTLCNACGVRYKSGRLLPEYRPAKSPTFMTCLHSNSHKKVLEMRNHNGSRI